MRVGSRRRLGLGVVVLLAGCSGSGFQYISNTDDDVFFKLPQDWAVFDEDDVITSAVIQRDALSVAELRDRVWLRGFDAGPEPSPDAVLTRGGPHPRGYAEVRRLTATERDTLSLATLRQWGFEFDPLDEWRKNPQGNVRILGFEEVTNDDGAHGIRIRILLRSLTGTNVVDQTVMVDSATSRLYGFTIGCSLECFTEQVDVIDEIAESWTLEEVP